MGTKLEDIDLGGEWIVIGPDGKRTKVHAGSERDAKIKVIFSTCHVQLNNRAERRKYVATAGKYKVIRVKY